LERLALYFSRKAAKTSNPSDPLSSKTDLRSCQVKKKARAFQKGRAKTLGSMVKQVLPQ
jgi:hypothetical protein